MHELERSDPIRPDRVRPERVRFGLIRPVTLLSCLALAACGREAPQALGTLEWDRIALPAPVAALDAWSAARSTLSAPCLTARLADLAASSTALSMLLPVLACRTSSAASW